MNWHHFLLISNRDSFAREIVPRVLTEGDRLSITSSPFDAFALMRAYKLDAVMVALEEDDENAAVLCRTLRRRSNLPIVLLVNPATRDQVMRGYGFGADTHIELPCDPRVFRARMGALLRRFQMDLSAANA